MSRCLKDRRSTGLSLLAILVVAILALAGPADAQVLYGSIVGNVTDTSQASVPGATVTAIHAATNLARETTTSGDGGYAFANLQEGFYTVRISLQGFKESVEEQIPVSPSSVSRVNIVLEVGSLTETVTVQSERTLLQTDAGDLHTILESEEITKLPLGNYRNYQSLLNLVPGVTPGGFQNAITDTPARALTNNVNGTARNNNTTRLDGATNVFVFLPHHQIYVAPAETVETVNVATASFDAEAGNSGGSHITVQTKSGTNEFHGSGTYLFENDSLRAKNFFNSGDKPETSRKIGALTLGGPIIKDKLFFFGAWEGHYQDGTTTRTGTLPTADQRLGNFSAYDSIIYDPATGNADGTGRTPFPGNIIPADRIHPVSAQIQALVPMPNASGTTGNYSDTGPFTLDRNNYDAKLNFNASNSLMFWGKYSHMAAIVESDMWLGNPQDGGIGGSGFGVGSGVGDTKVDLISGGFTMTVSPTLVLDGVLSYSNFDQEVLPPDFGVNYGLDVFGIPGTNGASPIAGGIDDIRYTGLPRWSISGYENLGGVDGWSPIFRNDNTYNASLNATWIKSSHEFRFGFDYVRLEQNHWQPELGHPRGRFNFGGGVTALNGGAASSQFNSYAQFLLGLSTTTQKSIQYDTMQARENHYGLYIRDRWQVNRNLTLTLGLRYETYPLMQRVGRGMETYDITTNEVILCQSDNCGIELKQPGILPRVGFAYRLGENNVIRGGFGRTATPAPYARPLRGFFPLMISNNYVSPSGFQAVSSFTEGIPVYDGPDRSLSRVTVPTTAEVRVPIGTLTRGYIDSWNLIYERRLPWDMSLSTGYVGTRSVDVLGYENLNASSVGMGQEGRPLFEPFGRTQNLWRWTGSPDLNANYHSLQVALNKPFARGLFVKAAYTWSKAMGRVEDEGWVNLSWAEEAFRFKNYSWQRYDRTQIFQLGFVWEMPFGRDAEGALSAIIKDWSVNGTVAAMSGTPFRVSSSSSSCNCPGNSQTADQVGPITQLGGIGSGNPYYDTSAWAPVSEVRYGNTGRNSVRGPGLWNVDLGLFRRFPIGDKVNLEFRVEAFNLTNTPHWNNPSGRSNSGSFMNITSTTRNAQERQVRLGASIRF
jgi:outer membrane receptor protein involved in Fe transport